MRDRTHPGDTIFLFFSGHGERGPDENGDEEDKLDEYLVPYDAVPGQYHTMIVDDEFARWLRELDGRNIVILLDSCFSGDATKGPDLPRGLGPAAGAGKAFDFLDGEMNRTKAVSRSNCVLLAASQADQLAWEFEDLNSGVFTYYFVQALDEAADTDGDGHLSPNEVFEFLQKRVSEFVRRRKPAYDQRPTLLDKSDGTLIVRP
jgi:uncharacterized caspase-like protein